jgi:DNA primase
MTRWVDFKALKQSIGIEQVLEDYGVRLKRVHKDYLRGRCPLPTHSSEASRESFGVQTARNIWACHSASCCGARQGQVGGTILDLVAWMETCTIREAALRLQARWGHGAMFAKTDQLVSKRISAERTQPTPPKLPFTLHLRGGHAYLDQRGIDRRAATLFEIGYVADRGFLRGRIVFPIHDQQGNLVAYAGRSLDNSEPRYLFPPGFHKSWVVYNLHRALGAAPMQAGRGIVVEGFFDCLKVHQAGYANVVALMGASLSEVQAQLLKEHFRDLVLMLDGDEAGQRASRVIVTRLRETLTLHIAQVPEGRQPDQLSPTEIQRILGRAARLNSVGMS